LSRRRVATVEGQLHSSLTRRGWFVSHDPGVETPG
jgi:hypothetical protein